MPVLTITNLTARRLPVDSRVGVLEANQQRSVELRGAGDPNGVVSGYPGDLYTDGEGGVGTTLYVKESGAGTDTGWVAK